MALCPTDHFWFEMQSGNCQGAAERGERRTVSGKRKKGCNGDNGRISGINNGKTFKLGCKHG